MDSSRSDSMYPSRGISPTLRSGPRQAKRHDASADEIIRFVREFQRSDAPRQPPDTAESSTGWAALRRKSVLPAIGDPGSRSSSVTMCNALDGARSSLQADSRSDSCVNISVSDSGFVDKASDGQDSNSEGNYNENNENASRIDDFFLRGDEDDDTFDGLEMVDPFKYKQGVTIVRGPSGSIFDDNHEERPLNPRNVFVEDQLVSSRTRKSSKLWDNLMVSHCGGASKPPYTAANLHNQQSHPASNNFSTVVSKSSRLLRPRALPQLPPISKNERPARPSAPSPSLTPPSPRSPVDLDGLEDSGDEEFSDNVGHQANGDDRHSEDPIDFIDCP